MEIELADTSVLPEVLKPFAVEADGKVKLNLAKVATDFEGVKGNAVTAQQEAIDRRKALKAWEALGTDPAEVQAKLAKGADPAIIEQMRADYATKETGFKAQLAKIVGERATADMRGELAKVGVIPSALDDLATIARQHLQIEDDGSIRVIGADGKPMIGQGANGGATLADLAKALATARPYAVADQGQGGTGRTAGTTGGTPTSKTLSTAQFIAMSHSDRMAFSKAGGHVSD
jgi:hypothetical protein